MMDRRIFLALPVAALALSAFAPAGEPAPRLAIRSIRRLPRPLPAPYDATVDAGRQVDAALRQARRRGKPLLIDFGANWCVDCRVLAGVLELPEMKPWIARNFELVQVDIGQFDRNLDIPRRFGVARLRAVPAVFVIDPRTRQMRNPGSELALGDARIMAPQAIADWLAQWTQ